MQVDSHLRFQRLAQNHSSTGLGHILLLDAPLSMCRIQATRAALKNATSAGRTEVVLRYQKVAGLAARRLQLVLDSCGLALNHSSGLVAGQTLNLDFAYLHFLVYQISRKLL